MHNWITRSHSPHEAIVFRRPTDEFGALSNMSRALPSRIYGIEIRSTEHLYQAMQFGRHPRIQQVILDQRTPHAAKRVARRFKHCARHDWSHVRVAVMYWALRVKQAMHWDRLSRLFERTGTRPFVYHAVRDGFWGAMPVGAKTLCGENKLGQLWMDLRQARQGPLPNELKVIRPPDIAEFRLLGLPVAVMNLSNKLPDKPLLETADLLRLGISEGPHVKSLLNACGQAFATNVISNRDDALAFVTRIEQARRASWQSGSFAERAA